MNVRGDPIERESGYHDIPPGSTGTTIAQCGNAAIAMATREGADLGDICEANGQIAELLRFVFSKRVRVFSRTPVVVMVVVMVLLLMIILIVAAVGEGGGDEHDN